MPPSEQQRRGQRAAARHLRVLLLRQGAYRDRWEAYAHDITPGEVSQSAVCQVVAQYLWDTGDRSEGDVRLPRKLKDRISRARNAETAEDSGQSAMKKNPKNTLKDKITKIE